MDVFLDPRLPDYFREHAWSDVRRDGGAAFSDFLGERIGSIHGCDLSGLDREFLARVSFPQTWEFKKLQAAPLLGLRFGFGLGFGFGVGTNATASMVLRDGFRGDRGAFKHFVEQLRVLRRFADDVLAAIVPVRPTAVNLVTRFSETRMEALHYDHDAQADDHEAFRLYVNLDAAPRIWATSYQLTELVRHGGQRLVDGVDDAAPAEQILKRVATRAFGGWNQRATERIAPRHLVYIDPGDVFFVDGRCVSHQVMSGQRVFTLYAKVPHAPAVAPTFARKLRGALAEARHVPRGAETAIVDYFEPKQVGASPNLRADWQTVFGETRTGRVRRFDARGLQGFAAAPPPAATAADEYDANA